MTPNYGTFSETNGSEPQSIPDFLRPSASYIPPTSGLFFGQVVQSPSLENLLPTRAAGDRLLQHYFDAVHPIARCVHRPSFEGQYGTFWEDATAGYEPRASIQAVVFAAWFSAAVALDEAAVAREFGTDKARLVDSIKIGTEAALSKANFLRTTRVETMQAFVMYMIPLCRDEVSRAHSVLVGAAVRMAECMGLHRDGEAFSLNPLETQVRRLIWHQLCFLDIRTCEAQGPKPAIRREDYDTKLPINCDEHELTRAPGQPPPASAEHWTSTTLPLMRFEINEMMRIIWADRRKLEARKTSLTQVLTKIGNFRKRMFEKYDRMLDERVPIQRYAKLVMHLLMYRLHVMVLHPYYANTANPMPARLNEVLIMSGITIIEIAIRLETETSAFGYWTWYLGAYQQYQFALLLATEMYYNPNNTHAERIWTCLDFVFGLDRSMPNEEKGRRILMEIMGKTGLYMSMRKMRGPTWITRASPSQQAVKSEGNDGSAMSPGGQQQQQQQQHHYHHHQAYTQHQHHPMGGLKEEPDMRQQPGMFPPGPGMLPPQMATTMMPPPGPPPNFVFAGVSNGEVLWSLPPPVNPDSPENSCSSDGGSVAGSAQRQGSMAMPAGGGGNMMEGIDWVCIHLSRRNEPLANTSTVTIPRGCHQLSLSA